MHLLSLYAQGYYMIGLPSETPESVAADLQTLASLKLDVTRITIVTPHPLTEMWSDLESNYGIPENVRPVLGLFGRRTIHRAFFGFP